MGERPSPLVPPEVDLRDFAFMPLDVQRLRDSDLASDETPEACWAAVLLWCASWHQVPAASIPDSDQWQAKQAGYVAQGRIAPAWRKVRAGALRGWVLCADGRLYHPVVAEKARDAWRSKLSQRWRTECGRIKKHNQRHGTTLPLPELEAWIQAGCPQGHPLPVPEDKAPTSQGNPGENDSKGQGQGQGQGTMNTSVPHGTDGAGAPAVDNLNTEPPAQADPPAPAAASADPPPQRPLKSPEDIAKAELWRAAVSVLEQGGCPAAQCRTFMGKLVRDYGIDVVREAVAGAVTAQPAEAREYLKAACQRLKGERRDPITVPSADADRTAAYLAQRRAEAAEIERQRVARKAAQAAAEGTPA